MNLNDLKPGQILKARLRMAAFPLVTPQLLEGDLEGVLAGFKDFYPRWAPLIEWLEIVPTGHIDMPFFVWLSNKLNGLSGAQPPIIATGQTTVGRGGASSPVI